MCIAVFYWDLTRLSDDFASKLFIQDNELFIIVVQIDTPSTLW